MRFSLKCLHTESKYQTQAIFEGTNIQQIIKARFFNQLTTNLAYFIQKPCSTNPFVVMTNTNLLNLLSNFIQLQEEGKIEDLISFLTKDKNALNKKTKNLAFS